MTDYIPTDPDAILDVYRALRIVFTIARLCVDRCLHRHRRCRTTVLTGPPERGEKIGEKIGARRRSWLGPAAGWAAAQV